MGQILSLKQAANVIQQLKQAGDKIILVGGCFDILHPGHILFLAAAKKIEGTLIVALESDETVKKLKGKIRPIHTQNDRAFMLSHLKPVDYVVLLPKLTSDKEYEKMVTELRPDVIAITENDPLYEKKKAHAKKVRGVISVVTNHHRDHSTTKITQELNI